MGDVIRLTLNTGIVAKIVLGILFILSIISWAITFQKIFILARAGRESKRFLRQFREKMAWSDLYRAGRNDRQSPFARVFVKGFQEFYRLIKIREENKTTGSEASPETATLSSVVQVLRSGVAEEMSRFDRHLPLLSTAVSASPLLGLFGTVWGVMQAFLSIGIRQSADIGTVGPGIAEALITTVVGLAVAIPALAAYNLFASRFGRLEDELELFAGDLVRLWERDWRP
ncbi:MotA/TolQ/ExbB proton channel family protein [bacterium]|nr:MotA/TolQ/ExbB proton channel family protein [bacterium]